MTSILKRLVLLLHIIVSVVIGEVVCAVMWSVFSRFDPSAQTHDWTDFLTLGMLKFTSVHTVVDMLIVVPLIAMLCVGFYIIGRMVLFLISLWWQAQKP
jgi:hypothetical protein